LKNDSNLYLVDFDEFNELTFLTNRTFSDLNWRLMAIKLNLNNRIRCV